MDVLLDCDFPDSRFSPFTEWYGEDPMNRYHTQPSPIESPIACHSIRSSIHELSRLSITPGETLYQSRNPYGSLCDKKAARALGLKPTRASPPATDSPSTSPYSTGPPSSAHKGHVLPQHYITIPPHLEPLNGRVAWLHALTALLVVFNCWGLNTSFGVFQVYYSRSMLAGTSPSTIAWIGSTQLALVFGLGVPTGRALDAGRRRHLHFRLLFHGGSALVVLGMFLTAQYERWWTLWAVQDLATGLGMGCVFCSGVVALVACFDSDSVGVAMGLGAAGSCVGAVAYALLAQHLLETHGFRTTMRVTGALAAVTLIPPNLVFRMRESVASVPEARGSSVPASCAGWRAAVDAGYMLMTTGMFFTFLGVYFGFVYMISYGSEILHLSNSASVRLLIYMSVANLPGRFIPALLSDRCIGPLNTMIPSTLLSAAVVWLWAASADSESSLTVIACYYGFASAGVQVLYAPAVHAFCREQRDSDGRSGSLDNVGVRTGSGFSAIGVACLIGTPIGGALIKYRIDRHLAQPYLYVQAFAGLCLLAGGLFLLASRVVKVGWAARRA
ncbi:hypothetical protein MBLNU459_g7403t1 [Dothideomycetes sp. NU459]